MCDRKVKVDGEREVQECENVKEKERVVHSMGNEIPAKRFKFKDTFRICLNKKEISNFLGLFQFLTSFL